MSRPCTMSLIRKHVHSLFEGQLFSTRDCLNFGRRGAVDQALSRLVQMGVILRVARGIFLRQEARTRVPSIAEIAVAKAKAFFRRIYSDADGASEKLKPKLTPSARQPAERSFFTNGSTSSFHTVHGRVYFRRVAPRKTELENNPHGLVIRVLWSLGRNGISDEIIQEVTSTLTRTDNSMLKKSCAIMPAWLVSCLVFR